ncbi:tRNA (adenosine(37)-N6)-dimethylallyltransferase MiaA [Rhizobium ruizarguesonis]|jgi:tRNA dimethylallyltransferase|uniref:tRNA (adenosine(37)-N6)-dimethylallyltransferase MiaA n=1 Tax=Rhizobium ruizarguesonis TaxID=2081791 RepID=UPI001031FCBD|nr:tRNA (adenosine(37)-N6)-dimethylallyltransferase MiaA [Rhizobium ruizarguesonis]MBY5851451.1 tRNA (adenosine(37)-N6)-dimethylallyltransferase MiaA [Rhizobium leguminosarum]NKL43333.1 tRNA (adenosine(37)-N6)-dimethylallyltransferase MiaA [Rhizobium leguminosarum bv. viciae]MBY5887524.1 tRNA (adenosine(37)-N6)-dimethylallyltransferase MiaA [Rhizobium leguminosarum]NKQ89542.1 tRNA (adenosine(37)-N6)-dimethylallyltransferase MiaA [Rhizobium ruizarguesonis]QSY99459.1 tRNA (adenosine(37)-N6)-dime
MMENLLSTVNAILITGPTASGKSALAVELARRHDGAVVNADSMQVYDTLRVLTARPSEEEMQGVPHHLYGHVPAGAAYSTGAWLRDVSALLPALRAAGRLPVFVGGTGLYFKALTGGLSDMPAIPEALRETLRTRLLEEGLDGLYGELAAADPAMAASLNRQDGQRIVRALEVVKATGRSIADFQGQSGPVIIDADEARKIVVLPDRAVLHQRINGRFEKMLQQGAEDEVRALLALDLPAEAPVMKAIGVSQITAMVRGEMTRDEVLEKGAAATRQYAKRQMTWFRNQMDDSWERLTV